MQPRSPGRRRNFTPEIENVIGALYNRYEIPCRELADLFAPAARNGKLSEAAVRLIANRVREEQPA